MNFMNNRRTVWRRNCKPCSRSALPEISHLPWFKHLKPNFSNQTSKWNDQHQLYHLTFIIFETLETWTISCIYVFLCTNCDCKQANFHSLQELVLTLDNLPHTQASFPSTYLQGMSSKISPGNRPDSIALKHMNSESNKKLVQENVVPQIKHHIKTQTMHPPKKRKEKAKLASLPYAGSML